ncbi:hypothetical protein ABZ438_19650, partial [Streptomyces sp. NPDC005786]|uniref:hypothetical protein n=1 Tax=Streptomyces sp. NPDC005786 TaxID=3154891 RepID=UPI0033F8AB22
HFRFPVLRFRAFPFQRFQPYQTHSVPFTGPNLNPVAVEEASPFGRFDFIRSNGAKITGFTLRRVGINWLCGK